MKFFHVYDSRMFEGLTKNNLINEDSAFKLQHSCSMSGDIKFNRIAAKGTFLYNLIKDGNYPFYIDRITGGMKYHQYQFDRTLIQEYRELLGDWFLGFQLHELGGGRRADWNRILQRMDGRMPPYDVEEMKKKLSLPYVTPDGSPVYALTHGSPEEYASVPYPGTLEKTCADLIWVIGKRMEETDGMVLSCDGNMQLIKTEHELGVKTFLPEVGAQIAHMRIEVALARGMARAFGKKWGTYYEPWIFANGKYTTPVFNPDPMNEWHWVQSQHGNDHSGDDFSSGGVNGGSSRLLQKRVYYYSLMSGAQCIGEEWGLRTSFSDVHTFELSPYGLLKKEFIDFARSHRQVEAVTPFAIVLPTDYDCVQLGRTLGELGSGCKSYMRIPTTPGQSDRLGRIQDVLRYIFQRDPADIRGNEGQTMQNSRFGDLFDILYADAPDSAFARYDCLIDADPDGSFAAARGGQMHVLRSNDLGRMETEIKQLAQNLLPCTADRLHWLLSKDENGRYLSIFNNEGNTRNLTAGDSIDRSADATVTVHTNQGILPEILYASSQDVRVTKTTEGSYTVFLPAADFVIFKY